MQGVKKQNLILFTVFCVISFVLCPFAKADDEFRVVYQSISDGQKNVALKPEIVFEFNHRLDPCDNRFTLNGSEALISGHRINGTTLSVFVDGALEPGTSYTLSLETLSDLYSNPSPVSSVTFHTADEYVTLTDDFEDGNAALSKKWYTNTFGYEGSGKLGVYADPVNPSNSALLLDAHTAQARIENPRYDNDSDGTEDFCLPGKAVIDFRFMFESYEDMVSIVSFVHIYSKSDIDSSGAVANTSLVRFEPVKSTNGGKISFMNGSGYEYSGYNFTYGEWSRVTISVDLYSSSMRGYVDGNIIYRGDEEAEYELRNHPLGANIIYNIQFKNNTVKDGKGAKIWLDDITVSPSLKISNSHFTGSDGNITTKIDSARTCYNVSIENTNPVGDEEMTVVAALYDGSGTIVLSSKIIPLALSAGQKKDVSVAFESLPKDSKLKIFFRRSQDTLTEISNITKTTVIRFP